MNFIKCSVRLTNEFRQEYGIRAYALAAEMHDVFCRATSAHVLRSVLPSSSLGFMQVVVLDGVADVFTGFGNSTCEASKVVLEKLMCNANGRRAKAVAVFSFEDGDLRKAQAAPRDVSALRSFLTRDTYVYGIESSGGVERLVPRRVVF